MAPDTENDIPEAFGEWDPKTAQRIWGVGISCALSSRCFLLSQGVRYAPRLLAYCNPLGFWSVFNAGFFRLDVSVGNILVVKRPFDSKQGFDVEALISQYGDDRTDT